MSSKYHVDIITYPPLIYVGAILIGWLIEIYIILLNNNDAGDVGPLGYGIMGSSSLVILIAGISFKKGGQNLDPHYGMSFLSIGSIMLRQ